MKRYQLPLHRYNCEKPSRILLTELPKVFVYLSINSFSVKSGNIIFLIFRVKFVTRLARHFLTSLIPDYLGSLKHG
jgi:hypothetical protein